MSAIVTNCKNGELVIHAPQCEIDQFVKGLESSSDVKIERQPKKPEPLPETVWNWDSGGPAFAAAVARSTKSDKPAPIPDTVWTFSPAPSKETPELVLN